MTICHRFQSMIFVKMKIINFDNNATTTVSKDVLEKITEVYNCCGNSSSNHKLGRKSAMIIEDARQELSDSLNASNYEIYFTSGGTEANNMAFFSDKYDAILFSKIEHSSVYNTRPENSSIIEFDIDHNCQANIEDIKRKVTEFKGKNFLLSLMYANSETGAIQNIKEVAKIVHSCGGLIHSDLVQAFGKIDIDLEDLNLDFASVSAHKINGPQGVGALIVRRGIDIKPLIYGGGHERGKRSGTLNTPGIAGFGEACKKVKEKLQQNENVRTIRDYLENEIKNIAKNDIMIFAGNAPRVANTCYMSLKNSDSQTALIFFDLKNIMISAGSACSSGSTKPSRVLEAMKIPKEFLGSMRISLCSDNTIEEAKEFIETFKEFYHNTRK